MKILALEHTPSYPFHLIPFLPYPLTHKPQHSKPEPPKINNVKRPKGKIKGLIHN